MSAADLPTLLEPLELPPSVRERLVQYGRMVLEANRRANLTAARSEEAIAEHLLDSLTLLPYIREPYVDVGSGAGFPAIPVAIVAGIGITMIESTAKKARLLAEFLESLGLGGQVLAERAEEAGHRDDLRERFASGTCRAVATAAATAELLLPLLALGGSAVLQRGRLDPAERRSLEDAALVLGGVVQAEYPLDGERRIVLVEKVRPTPARFPRKLAQKRPLCS